MKMMSTIKVIGASVLALSLASGGYGDWQTELHRFAERGRFSPRVTKDTRAVLGVNLDKEQVLRAVDLYADRVCTIAQLNASKRAMVKEKIAAYKQDIFTDVPADGRQDVRECGLYDANFRWVVVSLESFKYTGDVPYVEGLSVALAGQFDLEKFILFIQRKASEKADDSVSFRKVEVRGEDAWQLVPKDATLVREWREAGFDPYVTSLDGQLVLASSSRDALAKQIRLYRTGEGRGDALGDFSARKGDLLHLTLPGIREFVPQSLVPGDWLLCEGLELDLTLSPDGKVSETLRVRDGSVVATIPAIFIAAMFPVISSAMQNAKSEETSLAVEKGKKDKKKRYKRKHRLHESSANQSSTKSAEQPRVRMEEDGEKALSDAQRALLNELQEAEGESGR